MRVGIVGKFQRDSWCLGLADALTNLGHTVMTCEFLTEDAIKFKLAETSDLLIMIKGNNLSERLLRRMVDLCPGTTLFYTGDSITCGPGTRTETIGKKALLFDHVALTGKEGCEWIQKVAPSMPLAQIYQGVRHGVYKPPDEHKSYHLKTEGVCFLGHFYPGDGGRATKIGRLKQEFDVLRSHNIYMEDAADRYYRYAVSINFNCGELTSSRVLRVMASGGFMLTEANADVIRSFNDMHDLGVFKRGDVKDMIKQTRFYMRNKGLRRTIALNGMEKSKQYTWEIQAQKMLDFVFDGKRVVDGAAEIP